jgi:hypothetical protein
MLEESCTRCSSERPATCSGDSSRPTDAGVACSRCCAYASHSLKNPTKNSGLAVLCRLNSCLPQASSWDTIKAAAVCSERQGAWAHAYLTYSSPNWRMTSGSLCRCSRRMVRYNCRGRTDIIHSEYPHGTATVGVSRDHRRSPAPSHINSQTEAYC